MELSYQASPTGLTFQTQYNGNIAATAWSNPMYDGEHAYNYTYDPLNRIRSAGYKERTGSTWTVNTGHYTVDNLDYDHNGNILTLDRKGSGTLIDELEYSYEGNRLLAVNDRQNNTKGFRDGAELSEEYQYDANGNMVKDRNKGIDSICYNHLNLPEQIYFDNDSSIRYSYDATGVKLSKTVYDGQVPLSWTDYTGGLIFEQDTLRIIRTVEGRLVAELTGGEYRYQYQYHLKDHLGNVRLTAGYSKEEYVATMETENQTDEGQYFGNVTPWTSATYNTTTGGNEVIKLNSADNVGATFVARVLPGDTIDLSVYGGYESGSYGTKNTLATMVTAIAGAFGGIQGAGGESGAIYDGINQWGYWAWGARRAHQNRRPT